MEPPLVHPSGQSAHVNTQLDHTITTPKQRQELGANFESFFKELDEKASSDPLPDAPKSEPEPKPEDEVVIQPEPEKQPAPTEQKEEVKEPEPTAPVTSAPEPVPASVPATEIESLELHTSASPEQKGQFAQLKEVAKKFREKAKAYDKLSPLLKELGYTFNSEDAEDIAKTIEDLGPRVRTWKTGAMSPEVSQELENLREMQRAVDYKKSKEYIEQYQLPIQSSYIDILEEASKYFDAPEKDVATFLETMKTKFTPKDLNSEWWSAQVIESMKKADPAVKQKVLSKVADLLKLQEKNDKAVEGMSKTDAYQQWQDKRAEQMSRDYDAQVRLEVEAAFEGDKKHLKPWLPIPTQGVNDTAKLADIQKHNARFANLEKRFSDILMNVNSGPHKAARYALDFIELQERIPQLEKEVAEKESIIAEKKALEAEITKLRTEVTTKRKVSDVPLRAGSGTGKTTPEKEKLPTNSRESLREAFEKNLPS